MIRLGVRSAVLACAVALAAASSPAAAQDPDPVGTAQAVVRTVGDEYDRIEHDAIETVCWVVFGWSYGECTGWE